VISKDGKELASRYVSAHAPQVRVIFPNGGEIFEGKVTVRWQASYAGGVDNLTYSLLYSTDNGHTWQSVAKNIKESQLTVDLTELPGGTKALFRVIATDGVNTAIDDSGTFTVPSRSVAG
jgi:Neuraminidase (sialidase)